MKRNILKKSKIETINSFSDKLFIISYFLFCVSIPTSNFLDHVAAGIGLVALIISLILKNFTYPPLKPFLFLSLPQIISKIFFNIKANLDIDIKIIPYFVMYRAFKDKNKFKIGIKLLSISTILLCLSIIFEAITWINVKKIFLNFKLINNISFHKNIIRAKGFFTHPLTTAGVLYVLFVIFSFFYIKEKEKIYIFIVFLLIISIIFTGSRSYLLSLFTFFLFLLISLKFLKLKILRKRNIFVVIPILLICFILIKIPFVKYRIESIFSLEKNLERILIWRSYEKSFVNNFSVKEKLFGKGEKVNKIVLSYFPTTYYELYHKEIDMKLCDQKFFSKVTHNIYIYYLSRYGIFGLLGYLFFWAFFIAVNIKFYKNKKKLFPLIFIFGYLGFLVAGFFENNFLDAEVKFALMFLFSLNILSLKKYFSI